MWLTVPVAGGLTSVQVSPPSMLRAIWLEEIRASAVRLSAQSASMMVPLATTCFVVQVAPPSQVRNSLPAVEPPATCFVVTRPRVGVANATAVSGRSTGLNCGMSVQFAPKSLLRATRPPSAAVHAMPCGKHFTSL